MLDKYNETTALTFFPVNDKLETGKRINVPLNSGIYMGCGISINNELLVASAEEAAVKVEKFDFSTGKSLAKLSVPVDSRKGGDFLATLHVSKVKPDVAYVTVEYINSEKDKSLALFQLNFTSRKVLRDDQTFDKTNRRDFKATYTSQIKNAHKPDFDNLINLTFTNLVEHNGQLIVFKEIQFQSMGTGSGSSTKYFSKDGLLTVYNDKLKVVSQQLIPKGIVGFFDLGRSSAMHIHNNKVHIISGQLEGMMKYRALHTVYDLKTATLEKYEELEKQQIPLDRPADAHATLWFGDGFAVNYLKQKSMFRASFTTNLQKVSFE